MNMISASAAASATAPLPLDHGAETAACVFTAAGLLLPHLEWVAWTLEHSEEVWP